MSGRSKESLKAATQRYLARHPERRAATVAKSIARPEYKAWLRDWSKSPDQRAKGAARKRKERSTPAGALKNRLRVKLYRTLKRGRGGRDWPNVFGFTLDELKAHLERQFKRGMGWHNMGNWHIDHVVPLSAFTYSSIDDPEFKAAWALSNLQPLWKPENLAKSDRRTHLL